MNFEDFELGDRREFGSCHLSRDDIVEFATKYDPQSFHVDEKKARNSIFGGLIASGWQTCAVTMRMFVDAMGEGQESCGSPGVDEIRFIRPVRPGDTLHVQTEVVGKRRSKSRPNLGFVIHAMRVFNQNDELVMTLRAASMFRLNSV